MTQFQARPQQNWVGQTVGGRYKIEASLGHGGMSTVYRATDPNLRRIVAIKLIHPHLSNDPQFVRRFEQEAAAVAQLRHSNIIQVYDFNHDDGLYYMVLEYVPGETLEARLTRLNLANQRFSLDDTIRIMATICEAVAYAHRQGMIHRDLKPANVMLNEQDQPVLMDFGVTKILGDTHHTTAGTVVGTALYMSPEQARGERPDERADIYSLGVMLYEMVTGQPPFQADSAISIMMKHATQPVPDIRQVNKDTPALLGGVIEKALAKDPVSRYQTAGYMAIALRAIDLSALAAPAKVLPATLFMAPEAAPVVSMPKAVPGVQAAVQSVRQNRLSFWIMSIAVVALILGLGVGLLFLLPQLGQSLFGSAEGQVIASSGETSLPSAAGMVKIDRGVYPVGLKASDNEHAPPQQVELDEFWLDQYEVTNAQYAEFLAETDHPVPAQWPEGVVPAGQEQHPIVGVSWELAAAYCEWVNKRLPTEAEWEVAARGSEGRLYPWGDDQQAVQLPRSGTYEVGSKLTNQSPFGVFDMAGNVWEWVGDTYAPVEEGHRVLRGGANGFLKDMAYRLQGDPSVPTMVATAGVRCAANQVKVLQAENRQTEGVLFEDDFVDPGSGWPILSEGTYLFGYHPPDFYHVEVGLPNDQTVVSRSPDFEDVTVEIQVLVDHTNTESGDFRYGLALRRSGGNQYYALAVSSRTGSWYILKQSPTDLEVLAEGTIETLRGFAPQGFTPDKTDTLRVDASGADFTFHINDQVVAQIHDSDYASGEVGFFVETFDETLAHIHYDSLIIREVEPDQEGSAPAPTLPSRDDFTNPASGWPVITEDTYRVGYHPPDFYHVEVSQPNDQVVVTHEASFADVTVETEAFVDNTGSEDGDFRYGLALRRSGDQYYAFTLSPRTETWQVLKGSAGGLETLAEGKADSLQGLNPETVDKLRVDARGADFIFHVNDQAVAQVNDTDYTSGEVGFFVETFDETLVHIHYEALALREVEFEAVVITSTATLTSPTSASDVITPLVAASPTLRSEATATGTSEPPAATRTPEPAGMTLIPAGYFQMGSATGQANETPEHPVFLDAFYLDLNEVTNAQYRECIADGPCSPAQVADSYTHPGYRDDPAYDNYPVIGVTWEQADTYCGWADKRLPTEAEWEYAASGPQNFTWPWGNSFEASLSAASAADVQPVGSYPAGASPFGVFDMAGNVNEWVADVFDAAFYANSPASNPISTGSGAGRIYRGGSFGNADGAFYTTSRRYGNSRTFSDVDVGFRCAKDAAEATPPAEREALVTEFCQVFAAYQPDAGCP